MIDLNAIPWILLQNFVNAVTYIKRSPYISAANQPDQLKICANKTNLFATRVFRPSDSDALKLPLVIRIHGGGFIMNSPAADDALARFLADSVKCVVASMDYSKAPLHRFPAAYEDLIAMTLAAIEDAELEIDPQRVVLYGTSSGGNLALAIAQDPRLRSKIRGVIGSTPVVDLTIPYEEKMATRPDPTVSDFLSANYQAIKKIYIGDQDVSLEDVRISPGLYAKRDDLPEHIYLVSVEHDLLAKETEVMAERLARGVEEQKTGRGWQAGDVRWDYIRGQKHAFENFRIKDKELKRVRLVEVERMWQAAADWLRDVFAST